MKKGILFAGGVALTLAFAGCDDGSAKIAELQAELDAAKVKSDSLSLAASAQLDELTTTFQYKVDSLQYVIDSLTAPKGTTTTKPKPKPAPTEEPKKTEDPQKDRNSTGDAVNDQKQRNSSSDGNKVDDQKKRNP